jgi:uncharacterized membrane protein
LVGGRGGTHHLEVAAPPGVDVVRLTAEPITQPESGAPAIAARGFAPHVHIAVPAKFPFRYRATIYIRVSRPGWLTASMLVAFVIAWALVLGSQNLPVLFGESAGSVAGAADTAATLLLALLGVIAVWLVRPEEHPLASRLLRLVRFLLLVDVGAVLFGTGDLVLHRSTTQPSTGVWSVLAGIAIAVAAMVFLSWLMPRRPQRRRGNKSPAGYASFSARK